MEFKKFRLSYGSALGPIKSKTLKAQNCCAVFVDDIFMGKIYQIRIGSKISFEYRGLPIGLNNYEWIVTGTKRDLHEKIKNSLTGEMRQARRNFGKMKSGQRFRQRQELEIACALQGVTPPPRYRERKSKKAIPSPPPVRCDDMLQPRRVIPSPPRFDDLLSTASRRVMPSPPPRFDDVLLTAVSPRTLAPEQQKLGPDRQIRRINTQSTPAPIRRLNTQPKPAPIRHPNTFLVPNLLDVF